MAVESPLQKELRLNAAFDKIRKIQEARIIAPDIIEWMEEMQAEIVVMREAVASLINHKVREQRKCQTTITPISQS